MGGRRASRIWTPSLPIRLSYHSTKLQWAYFALKRNLDSPSLTWTERNLSHRHHVGHQTVGSNAPFINPSVADKSVFEAHKIRWKVDDTANGVESRWNISSKFICVVSWQRRWQYDDSYASEPSRVTSTPDNSILLTARNFK